MSIYQYTQLDAVKNILKTNIIRATHYTKLNDQSEVLHGIKLIIEKLRLERRLSRDDVNILTDKVMNKLSKLGIYLSSFCLAEDELSMWDRYGNYAIVFDKNSITLGLTVDGPFRQNSVFPCIYPNDNSEITLSRTLLYLYDNYYLTESEDWFISNLVYDSTSIKFPAFYSEYEHRAAVSIVESDGHTIIENSGKPYIELLLPNKSITGIQIGPILEQEKMLSDINNFLYLNGFSHIDVSTSGIPYKRK